MRLALRSLRPVAPYALYTGGLVSLVAAGFVFCLLAGLVCLGVALLAAGYMAEVNQ